MTTQPDTAVTNQKFDDDQWRPIADVDGHYADWLVRRGLLTPDLRASFADPVVVDLLKEGTRAAPSWALSLLGAADRDGWYREITLGVGGTVLVHAACFAPSRTLRQHPWIQELGTQPLGSTLARIPDTTRAEMLFAPGSALGDSAADGWSRRSVFDVAGAPLMLVEHLAAELGGVARKHP
ncbi:MAG: chorismate lyase [Pseudomonadota bacterium]